MLALAARDRDRVAERRPRAAAWPDALPVAPEADAGLIARRLRMAATWAGQLTPGRTGRATAPRPSRSDLVGQHATVTLSLLVNPATGELRQADVAF